MRGTVPPLRWSCHSPRSLGAELQAREYSAVQHDAMRWQHGAVTVHPTQEPAFKSQVVNYERLQVQQLKGTAKI